MSDRLTEKLKKQLESMGIAATDNNVAKMLSDPKYRERLTDFDQSYKKQATMADAVGTFLWHTADASTAGVLGLTTESTLEKQYGKPWEEKETRERIGAALGEVAGLINPYGAFGMFSKALRGTVSLASKNSTRAITKGLAEKSGETAAEFGGAAVGKKVQDIIGRKTFSEVIKRETPALGLGGAKKIQSIERIRESISAPVFKALDEAGVRTSNDVAMKIVEEFAVGMQSGRHINSISGVVSNMLPYAHRAGFAGKLNKYVGQVAQDMVMLGIYNGVAGNIESAKTGNEFDAANSLKHSLYLSLAFPAARAIPGGGRRSLKEFKGLMGKWGSFNPKKLDDNALDSTIKILTGGKRYGTSRLQNMEFKIGGKTKKLSEHAGADDFIKNGFGADKVLARKGKEQFINQVKDVTFSKGGMMNAWGIDMIQSIPRMAVGAAANNVDMWKDGMWTRIPPEELLTHLLIGAFFTRGRGEWLHGKDPVGKTKERDSNLTDMYQLADFLRLPIKDASGKDLESYLKFEDINFAQKIQSVALESDETMRILFPVVGKYHKIASDRIDEMKENQPLGAKSDPVPRSSQLNRIVEYYNTSLLGKDTKQNPLRLSHLTNKEISDLQKDLANSAVKVSGKEGTTPFGEVGLGRIEVDSAINSSEIYQTYLERFFNKVIEAAQEGKIDINGQITRNESTGKREFRLQDILPKEGDSDGVHMYKNIISFLKAHKLALETETPEAKHKNFSTKVDPQTGESESSRFGKIVEKIKKDIEIEISREIFADESLNDNIDLFGEVLKQRIGTGKAFELADRWYKISKNDVESDSYEESIAQQIDKYFSPFRNENSILSWDVIKQKFLGKKDKNKDWSKDEETQEYLKEEEGRPLLRTLKFLHDIAKKDRAEINDSSAFEGKDKIDINSIREVQDVMESSGLSSSNYDTLPSMIKQVGFMLEYNRSIAPEKLMTLEVAKENGLVTFVEGAVEGTPKMEAPSKEALNNYLESNETGIEPARRIEIVSAWGDVLKFWGSLDGTLKLSKGVAFTVEGTPKFTEKDIMKMRNSIPEIWIKEKSTEIREQVDKLDKTIETQKFSYIKTKLEETLSDFLLNGDAKIASENMDTVLKPLEILLNDTKSKTGLKALKELKSFIKTELNKKEGQRKSMAEFFESNGERTSSGEALRRALLEPLTANELIRDYLNEIQSMGAMHSSRPEAYIWFNFMKERIIRDIGSDKYTENNNLVDILEAYNSTNSFADYLTLAKSLASYQSLKQGYKDHFAEKSKYMYHAYEDYLSRTSEIHEHVAIDAFAKEYNIQSMIEQTGLQRKSDRTDPINEEITRKISSIDSAPDEVARAKFVSELVEQVNQKLDQSSFTPEQIIDKKKSFIKTGLPWLLNTQLGSMGKKTLTFKNGVFHTSTEIVRKSRRYDFIDNLFKESGIEIVDVNHDQIQIIDPYTNRVKEMTLSEYYNSELGRKSIESAITINAEKADQEAVRFGEEIPESVISGEATGYHILFGGAGKAFGIRKSDMTKLHSHYTDWFNKTVDKWTRSGVDKITIDNFKNAFGDFATKWNDNGGLEIDIKFRGLYIDTVDPIRFKDLFFGDNGEPLRDAHTIKERVGKWEEKTNKYTKQFEGGNGTQVNNKAVEAVAKTHPDPVMRKAAETYLKRKEVIVKIDDETSNDIFIARDAGKKSLTKMRDQYEDNHPMRAHIEEALRELEDPSKVPSLLANEFESVSSKNALTYIDEVDARMFSVLNGKDFDPSQINGWKNNLSYVSKDGTESVQQKTWMIYDPDMASQFTKLGASQISFGSALKTFGSLDNKKRGVHISLDEMKKNGFEYDGESRGKDWIDYIKQDGVVTENNKIYLDNTEAVSLGFHNHKGESVTAGHTLNNLQGIVEQAAYREYQKLDGKLKAGEKMYIEMLENGKNEIYEAFENWSVKDQEGFQSDNASLALKLVELGVSSSNPVIRGTIERLFMSKWMQTLRKPIQGNGMSSYLTSLELYSRGDTGKYSLASPVYSKSKNTSGDPIRNQLVLGGVAAPADWGAKRIIDKNAFRLSVPSKVDGRDIIVGYENNKIQIIDPLKNGKTLELKDIKDKTELKQIKELIAFIDSNNPRTSQKNLTMELLADKVWDNGYDVVVNSVAIPRKSADVTLNKVEMILSKDKGNNWVLNDYELAVTHQRDFDGDHIYTYNDLPMKMMSSNLWQTAQIRDYMPLERQEAGGNSFGFNFATDPKGASNKAGNLDYYESPAQTRAKTEAKRKNIGMVIGMNTPLTWMDNLGLRIGGRRFKFNLNEKDIGETLEVMGRNATVGQVAVDYVKAEPKLLKDKSGAEVDLLDVMLFGKNGENIPLQSSRHGVKNSQADYQAIDTIIPNREQREIQQEIVKQIALKLRNSSIVFNDPYDGGRRRATSLEDIRRAHDNVHEFFIAPQKVIYLELMRKYKNDPTRQMALTKFFYQGVADRGIQDAEKTTSIMEAVFKDGKFIEPDRTIISFDASKDAKISGTREYEVESLFGTSTAGHLLRQMAGPGKIVQRKTNGKGISEVEQILLAADKISGDPTNIANEVFSAVMLSKMLGINREDAALSENVASILNLEGGADAIKRSKLSLSLEILDGKQGRIIKEMDYLQSSHNKQNGRISELRDELETARISKEIILESLLRNAVKDAEGQPVSKPDATKSLDHYTRKAGDAIENKGKKTQYVYKIKDDAELTFKELSEEGVLSYVGYVKPKDTMFTRGRKNERFIVLNDPVKTESLSNEDVLYGQSFLMSTQRVNTASVAETVGKDETMLISDMLKLKEDLRSSVAYARENSFDQSVLSRQIWETQSDFEQNKIMKFMRKFSDGDEANIQDLATLLLVPDPAKNHIISDKQGNLPLFKVNYRLQKAVYTFMNENNHLYKGSAFAETIKDVESFYDFYTGAKSKPPQIELGESFVDAWGKENSLGDYSQTVNSLNRREHPMAQSLFKLMKNSIYGLGRTTYKRGKFASESGTSHREDAIIYHFENKTSLPFKASPDYLESSFGIEGKKKDGGC